jgi:hypothetical protein
MALDTRIALGVQPVQQQPNMLAQYAQIMGIKAAQQEMEGSEDVRRYFSSPADQRGDISQIMHTKGGRAASETLSQNAQRDLKMQLDALGAAKANVYMAKDPASLAEYMKGVYSSPAGKLLSTFVPVDKALAAIPTDPVAFKEYQKHFGLTADQIVTNVTKERGQNMTYGATIRGQDMTDARMRKQQAFEQNKPIGTVTGEDGYLYNRMPDGTVRQVMMGGAPVSATAVAPPVAGGGVGGGGSVNALAGTSVNALNAPVAQPSASNQPFKPKPTGPMVSINNVEPASETALKQYMKAASDTHTSLKQAPSVLQNIEDAKRLVAGAKGFMGTGGETMLNITKFLNNRLGTDINTEGVKSAEELNSRLFMGILDNLKKLDSQPSQSQQAAMKEALGNLGTDPNAMNNVLDVFGDILRNKVEIYNQEVTDAEARGVKFPYNPVIKLKERTPANTGDIATDAGIAKVIKSNAEFNALPSGTIFTAPDGTTRRKP